MEFLLLQSHHTPHIFIQILCIEDNFNLNTWCIICYYQVYNLEHKECTITHLLSKLLNHILSNLVNCKSHIYHQQVLIQHCILHKLYLILNHLKIHKTRNTSFLQCYMIDKFYLTPSWWILLYTYYILNLGICMNNNCRQYMVYTAILRAIVNLFHRLIWCF